MCQQLQHSWIGLQLLLELLPAPAGFRLGACFAYDAGNLDLKVFALLHTNSRLGLILPNPPPEKIHPQPHAAQDVPPNRGHINRLPRRTRRSTLLPCNAPPLLLPLRILRHDWQAMRRTTNCQIPISRRMLLNRMRAISQACRRANPTPRSTGLQR